MACILRQHRFQCRLHPVFEPISPKKRYPMRFAFYTGIPQSVPFTLHFVSWILSFKWQTKISSECYNYLCALLAAFFYFCPVFSVFWSCYDCLPFFCAWKPWYTLKPLHLRYWLLKSFSHELQIEVISECS